MSSAGIQRACFERQSPEMGRDTAECGLRTMYGQHVQSKILRRQVGLSEWRKMRTVAHLIERVHAFRSAMQRTAAMRARCRRGSMLER